MMKHTTTPSHIVSLEAKNIHKMQRDTHVAARSYRGWRWQIKHQLFLNNARAHTNKPSPIGLSNGDKVVNLCTTRSAMFIEISHPKPPGNHDLRTPRRKQCCQRMVFRL